MTRLLIVDDEDSIRRSLAGLLSDEGYEIVTASDGNAALALLREEAADFDLVLLDIAMPGRDGMQVLEEAAPRWPDLPFVMMSGHGTIETAVKATRLGAFDFIEKPLSAEKLLLTLQHALENRRLATENQRLRAQALRAHEILGTSEPIQRLKQQIAQAAPTNGWVLITGENGTGKELVARQIHLQSKRASEPFVEVNCAALPEGLVESELFGHQKGAFTDAKTAHAGLFQAADTGTLFLDEIGCLPLAMQVKLLKAIEEKTIRSVGASSDRMVDVHVVAATNSDLETMVRSGAFREDLYYRLGVVVLRTPPLRDRGEDILTLARRVVGELCTRYRQPAKQLSAQAEAALQRYAWPGNVRELRNTLDRAVLFTEGAVIEPDALGLPHRPAGWMRWRLAEDGAVEVELPSGGIQFDALERALIVTALAQSGGRQIDAAKLLGMSRDTLRYRIEKFGIDIPRSREG